MLGIPLRFLTKKEITEGEPNLKVRNKNASARRYLYLCINSLIRQLRHSSPPKQASLIRIST
jgi:hypothetical protein